MTWYDPATHLDFSVGESPTAAKMDKIGADLLALRNELPRVQIYQGVPQTLVSGTGWTTLAFDTENLDVGPMHDTATNNSRINIVEAGCYLFHGQATFDAGAADAAVGVRFLLNGTLALHQIVQGQHPVGGQGVNTSGLILLSAGDWIELQAYQNDEVDLNTRIGETFMFAYRIGS